jgi:dolichol-phosphate mannosyltransferase
MNSGKIFIVMPVGNEEETMADTLDRIMALGIDDIVVTPVIDSFSKDRTREIIKSMESKYPGRIMLIENNVKTGLVQSYLFGFKNALSNGAKYIVEMDAGNSHLPEQIPMFVQKLNEGYECVWGSRFTKGGKFVNHPFSRILISWLGTLMSNVFLGTKMKDATSGFEAFRSDALSKIDLDAFISTGHFYQTEMRFYCKDFKTIEIPITYTGSKSRFSSTVLVNAFKEFLEIRKNYNEKIAPRLLSYKNEK